MIVRSLDAKKYPFRLQEDDKEPLGPEVPYLSAIEAMMYVANYTCLDISFMEQCVWLRSLIQCIQGNCGLNIGRMDGTINYEYNTA